MSYIYKSGQQSICVFHNQIPAEYDVIFYQIELNYIFDISFE